MGPFAPVQNLSISGRSVMFTEVADLQFPLNFNLWGFFTSSHIIKTAFILKYFVRKRMGVSDEFMQKLPDEVFFFVTNHLGPIIQLFSHKQISSSARCIMRKKIMTKKILESKLVVTLKNVPCGSLKNSLYITVNVTKWFT